MDVFVKINLSYTYSPLNKLVRAVPLFGGSGKIYDKGPKIQMRRIEVAVFFFLPWLSSHPVVAL